jgi:hypothetical protein
MREECGAEIDGFAVGYSGRCKIQMYAMDASDEITVIYPNIFRWCAYLPQGKSHGPGARVNIFCASISELSQGRRSLKALNGKKGIDMYTVLLLFLARSPFKTMPLSNIYVSLCWRLNASSAAYTPTPKCQILLTGDNKTGDPIRLFTACKS